MNMRDIPDPSMGNIWAVRRKVVRDVYSQVVKSQLKKKNEMNDNSNEDEENNGLFSMTKDNQNKLGFVSSVLLLTTVGLIFRIGGRTAFISFLGLDFAMESDIKGKIDSFIALAQGLGGGVELVIFLFAWIIAKALCIDAFTIILVSNSSYMIFFIII